LDQFQRRPILRGGIGYFGSFRQVSHRMHQPKLLPPLTAGHAGIAQGESPSAVW
jgi:hypothetical protein